MQRSAVPVEGVEFVDTYGDTRVIHHNHGPNGPLRVKRTSITPALAMNPVAAKSVGRVIHDLRIEGGWTLLELAQRAGLRGGKNAMWAIENGLRGAGVRLGTLYALAIALGVEAGDLLPSVSEVANQADVRMGHHPEVYVDRVA